MAETKWVRCPDCDGTGVNFVKRDIYKDLDFQCKTCGGTKRVKVVKSND